MEKVYNIKLKIAYDGTRYLGWQKTPMGPSIEETLQKAIEDVLEEPIILQAASRTDAGVHAQAQVVNFFTKCEPSVMEINARLPEDIAVLHMEKAADTFHPTLDCTGKEYHYLISLGPVCLPEYKNTSWHFPHAIDTKILIETSQYLKGVHDFASLCNVKKNETYKNTIREVTSIEISLEKNLLQFKIRGNHFLYKMVRNIVGTLISVANGKIDPKSILEILKSKDRRMAGVTAPALGLTLYEVFY